MYTPHTVTLILADEGDNGINYYPVVLRGVFLDLNKRSNVNKSGLADADAATLFVPMSINPGKEYVTPKVWKALPDKSNYWTLFDGGETSGAECYFVKGVAATAVSYAEARNTYDYVYRITSVDLRDFGHNTSMHHWMVGGK